MADLTSDDVLNGKAIPHRGDTVDGYLYVGGDPLDNGSYRAPQPAPAIAGTAPPVPGEGIPAPVGRAASGDPPGLLSAYMGGDAGGPTSSMSGMSTPLQVGGPSQPAAAGQNPPQLVGSSVAPQSSQIGSSYLQAMNDRLQKSLLGNMATQVAQENSSIPLVNGRRPPGGQYQVIPGHFFPTDATFAPDMADALTGAIQEMNAAGITPQITDGFRTAAQQQILQQHRGKLPAARISWHQTANAVDLNSKIAKDFPTIVAIMQKHGFAWGNSFGDPVHFRYLPAGNKITSGMLQQYGGD